MCLCVSMLISSSLWCLVPWFTGTKPLRPSSASTRRSSVPPPLSQWQTRKRRTCGEEFCWSSSLTRRLQKSSFFHFSFSSSKRCGDTERDFKKNKESISIWVPVLCFLEKCFKHGSFVMRRLHQCLLCISFGNSLSTTEMLLWNRSWFSSQFLDIILVLCVIFVSCIWVWSPNF